MSGNVNSEEFFRSEVSAVLVSMGVNGGDIWLVDVLKELGFLEASGLGGDCGLALRRLRRRLVRGAMRIHIRTSIVRGEYAKTQAPKSENVKRQGLQNMTVTYIPGPEARELVQDPGAESLTDDEVRMEGFWFGRR